MKNKENKIRFRTAKGPFNAGDVCVAVMNYNGLERLRVVLSSLRELVSPPGEIVVCDDGSTDGSVDYVEKEWPDVVVHAFPDNRGILNRLRNRALDGTRLPLVFFVDNDVVLKTDTLEELIRVFNERPEAAACITRAVFWDEPGKIYQDGQTLHYVGSSPNSYRGQRVDEVSNEPRKSIGWGVQMVDRRSMEEIGGCNEAYPIGWGDDGEFNYRLNLAGFVCFQVPRAVVYHKRDEGSARYYAAVRNRLRWLLEMYQWRTLVLTAPAMVLYEISLVGFLLMKGELGSYFRGWVYFFGNLKSILRTRSSIQKTRLLPDRELMGAGDLFTYDDYLDSKVLRIGLNFLNGSLNLYWKLIKKLL